MKNYINGLFFFLILIISNSAMASENIIMHCKSSWDESNFFFKYEEGILSNKYTIKSKGVWKEFNQESNCIVVTEGDKSILVDYNNCKKRKGQLLVDFETFTFLSYSWKKFDDNGVDITKKPMFHKWTCEKF